MARYHGQKGLVMLSTSAAGPVAAAISINQWTGDFATDKVDVTCFQDLNKVYVQGLKDLKGTIKGFWDSANDALFDAADSTDGCVLYLYPASTYPSCFWYGSAWLDASIDVPAGGAVAVSASFVAKGSWGRLP